MSSVFQIVLSLEDVRYYPTFKAILDIMPAKVRIEVCNENLTLIILKTGEVFSVYRHAVIE